MWSFGCILYQLCTNDVLFPEADPEDPIDENFRLLSRFINTVGLPPNANSIAWVDYGQGTDFATRTYYAWEDDPEFAENVIDLLRQILRYENRITPQKALEHKLFQ